VLRAVGEDGVLRVRPREADRRLWMPMTVDALADGEAVWLEFHDRMRRFVLKRVRNEADADDIVQKVFLQMHRSLRGLRNGDRMDVWLYRIARNAITDYYRAPARRRELAAGSTAEMDVLSPLSSEGRGDASEVAGAAACLRPMLDGLPPEYGRALRRVDLDGETQRSVAEAEGISVSGMKARVQRGRRRLREILLECCEIELDRRGGVMECASRGSGGSGCQEGT
jgi:RNA polymerase sigma-70 factor, ECF subfamily